MRPLQIYLRYPLNTRLGVPYKRSGRFGEEKNLVSTAGFRTLDRLARSLVPTTTRVSRLRLAANEASGCTCRVTGIVMRKSSLGLRKQRWLRVRLKWPRRTQNTPELAGGRGRNSTPIFAEYLQHLLPFELTCLTGYLTKRSISNYYFANSTRANGPTFRVKNFVFLFCAIRNSTVL
jgi:hypothetical protein